MLRKGHPRIDLTSVSVSEVGDKLPKLHLGDHWCGSQCQDRYVRALKAICMLGHIHPWIRARAWTCGRGVSNKPQTFEDSDPTDQNRR